MCLTFSRLIARARHLGSRTTMANQVSSSIDVPSIKDVLGLPSDIQGELFSADLQSLFSKTSSAGTCDFILQLSFQDCAHDNFGAPGSVWATISLSSTTPIVANVTLGLFNKTQTRLPETMFLQFNPSPQSGTWDASKLDEWVNVHDIVDGGSKSLEGVLENGVRFSSDQHSMQIQSMDAAVVRFGNLSGYPTPVNSDADITDYGSSFVLWDNLWGTNYIMWWPFEQPPPQEYSASAKYFPADWNSDMIGRFSIVLI
eukprot:m.266946 g.266946  ORF g.266946 m.266946 type:complete len:257 (+) comp16240_c0_seq31:1547-2317(+)